MIYVLSILDGLQCGIVVLALLAAVFGMISAAQEDDLAAMRRPFGLAVALVLIASLMPTQESLTRAYLMTEGAKVITAQNAEKAIAEMTKRIDKVLEVLQ